MVLIVGGEESSGVPATSQIFDPYTNGYLPAPSLSEARRNHTATLLGDGTVLVVGGQGASGELSSAEIYDPGSKDKVWKKPPNALSKPRYRHTATLLSDGRVLVTGGVYQNAALATGEIYEPGTKQWSPIADMSVPRVDHTAVALSNGKVLVAGGSLGGVATKSTETYDPDTNQWFKSGELSTEREEHTATRLGDGRVLIAGGMNPAVLDSAELFKALQLGEACEEGSECLSGFCSGDKVCCNQACPVGCGTCKQMGNSPKGVCTILDASKCHNKCESESVICEAFDLCHLPGTCDPKSGRCSNPGNPDCVLPEDPPEKPTADEGAIFCENNDGCESGFCVEGVCCDSACDMPKCRSCVVPGKFGKCSEAEPGTDPRNHCSAPYECDKTCAGGDAGTLCMAASEGTKCSPSECFEDGIHGAMAATCSEELTCSRADRIPFNCSPFRCIKGLGVCSTSCSKIEDCAVPYVCSPEGECVAAPPISSGYASSCSLASAPTSNPESSRAAWIAMLVAGLLAARRKQKLSANPQA
jgi:hypothetical protein